MMTSIKNSHQLKSSRLLHLDLLRLVAIYLVIFNHTGNRGYTLFENSMDSPMYFLYMIASVFCKIAVPLFFMISGALLLPKEESYKQLFKKRILRIAVVLILISIPYYLWLKRTNGLSVSGFFTYIYGNSASTSLWYLYSYIGFLLMLPFLRKMVKNMQSKDFIYLLIGYITMVGVLPGIEYCFSNGSITIHEDFQPVLFTTQSVFYGLMGYYLEHVFDPKILKVKVGFIGGVMSVLALFITCIMTHFLVLSNGTGSVETSEIFFNYLIAVPTITVYGLVKWLARRIKGDKLKSVITLMGSAVFGVYLIEKIIRALTDSVYMLFYPVVGSFVASLTWTFVVWIIGLIIVVLIKHTPIIKRIVNKFI